MSLSSDTSHAGLHHLDRPGGRIAYELAGEGPLVVCVPGMGDLRSTWRHLAPGLVQAGWRVATLDLRGHGDSDTTFDTYDDPAAGDDVVALIRHLDAGPAVVVGNSMGAAAAMWAAAEAPELVAGLVLVGPFVRDLPMPLPVRLALRAVLRRPWGPAAFSAYYAKAHPGHRPDDLDEHRERIRTSLHDPDRWRCFVRTTRTSHAPVEARLDEVRAPTLVVMGADDPDFPDPAAEARTVADRLGAEVLLIEGAGHYPHAQHPEVVTPAVIELLGRIHRGA